MGLATSAMGMAKDADLPLIVEALHERGVDAVAVRWDVGDFDWSQCTAAIIRSTWGYADRLPEYLGWADEVASVTQLDNPASFGAVEHRQAVLAGARRPGRGGGADTVHRSG
ncbi:hypothetical protein ACU686_35970 [Yinghuangia aomiensis]